MEVSFESFRCFGETQTAKIAPITLLVGENSAGKSTFMAGLRYILDFTRRSADPSFNKDPFFLGGFRSIAHFRGTRRAPQFKIGISETFSALKDRSREPDMFSDEEAAARALKFVLTFADVDGDARPVEYCLRVRRRSIRIYLEENNIKAIVEDADQEFAREITISHAPRIFASGNDFLTLEFFLRDLALVRLNERTKVDPLDSKAAGIVEDIWAMFRRLGGRRPQVFATAPVRTRPLRSYDPTQLSQSSEGDQLISQLGRMARVDAPAWQRMRSSLEAYGSATGLFESIKIQKLGRGDTDPFQILVKASGRETNIIDVGYGISQVLPLFILLGEVDRRATLLIQQPEVHLHPSAQAALGSVIADAASKMKGSSFVIETHSDFIVDRIRMAVRDKKIKSRDVGIIFFEKGKNTSELANIEIDEFGEMINPPKAYREFFLRENMSIMGF